jgi:hypothetical protein
MSRFALSVIASALYLFVSRSASAEAPRIEGAEIVLTSTSAGEQRVAIGCTPNVTFSANGLLYFACDDGTYGAANKGAIVGKSRIDGRVQGFFQHNDRVWIEVARIEARPATLEPFTPAAPRDPRLMPIDIAAPPAPSERTPPPAKGSSWIGEVVGVGRGEVMVGLDAGARVPVGSSVELISFEQVDLGDGERTSMEHVLAVGVVSAVSKGRAQVRLGINERVPEGARARKTITRPTGERVAPPRVGGTWELGFVARPFLPLDTLGIGMVSELELALRFDGPFSVHALVAPLGVGIAKEADVVPLAGSVIAAYDIRVFEIGFGFGGSMVNDAPSNSGRGSGFTVDQMIRLGARDGLALIARNSFVLFNEEFEWGATQGLFQIPIFEDSWLLGRGGAGLAGYGFGEAGLRFLLRGNGDAGSLFLTATLGGAVIFSDEVRCMNIVDQFTGMTFQSCQNASYGGPLVGFGMEWRGSL